MSQNTTESTNKSFIKMKETDECSGLRKGTCVEKKKEKKKEARNMAPAYKGWVAHV